MIMAKSRQESGIELSQEDVKAICKEYRITDDDYLTLNDEQLLLKQAINSLSPSDYIIFCLYCELASERRLAKTLGLSRTPISKCLKDIRQKINEYIETHNDTD